MGSASDAAENWILDAMLGDNHTANFPSTLYIALFTTTPTDGGGGVEVPSTGNNYYRATCDNDSATWPDAASSTKSNAVDIQFPNALDPWGTIVAFGIFDSLEDGTLIIWGELDMPRTISAGSAPFFAAGDFTITAD